LLRFLLDQAYNAIQRKCNQIGEIFPCIKYVCMKTGNHMPLPGILSYLLIWGTIGAVLFSIFVILVFRSGIVYTTRNEDGLLKERVPLSGYLTSGGFLLMIVIFLVAANYFGLYRTGFNLSF
jgi:hypothetical protein